jgi:hypothetical protein
MGALSLAGCTPSTGDPVFINRQFVPVGDWSDGYGGSYSIDKNTLKYNRGFGQTFESTIVDAVDFSSTSGVLIIRVNTASPDEAPSEANFWFGIDNYSVGSYTGVYYKDYTTSHVYLASPIDQSTNTAIEVSGLNAALTTFTAGNAGTHVTEWGTGYSK